MTDRSRFRFLLDQRIRRAIGLGAMAAPVALGAASACGGEAVVDVLGQGGSSSSASSSSSTSSSSSASSSGSCTVGSSSGGTISQQSVCLPSSQPCPADEASASVPINQALQATCCSEPDYLCDELISVDCGPYATSEGNCCFVITSEELLCGVPGRPLVGAQGPILAQPRRTTSWQSALSPSVDALPSAERALLAEHWTEVALAEHASIASFGHAALELLAAGAPAELVEAAHHAAIDEVHHARLAFALATAYDGSTIGPSALPLQDALAPRADLPNLALRTFLDGCVNETLAAMLAAELRDGASDPAVREVLDAVAEEEAVHAELAWRTVAWALREGGDPVRRALVEASDQLDASPIHFGRTPAKVGAHDRALLARHGLIDRPSSDALVRKGLADVVAPCARALLES